MFARKFWEKILPFAAAACLFAMIVPAMAAEIDPGRTGSISVSLRAYATEEVVGGGSLALYQIAGTTVTAEEGAVYHYTEDFSGCGGDLLTEEALARAETAEFFAAWVTEHTVAAATTDTVNADGQAAFMDLACGLYLVTQSEPADGYQPINAFLVSVPIQEDDIWIYNVDATPKTSPVTKEPTDEPKVEPGIPDTGNPNPDGSGGTTGGNTPSGTGSTTEGGGGRTGDVHSFVYGVLLIGAVLVIVVVLRRRANRRAR